jgi:hypothetical protein
MAVGFSDVTLALFCVEPSGKARGEGTSLGLWIWSQDFERDTKILPLRGLALTTKNVKPWTEFQVHHSALCRGTVVYASHPLQCCTISCSWKRVTYCLTEKLCCGNGAGLIRNILRSDVGLPPVLATAAHIVMTLSLKLNVRLYITTSDEWHHPNPCLLNLVTVHQGLFYAFLL